MSYPYQKHIWVTREIIRREYLQNISDGIYDEQQARLQAEAELAQAIADEESRATSAEEALSSALQAESTRAQTAESTETTRAQSAESNLSSQITAETTRATGAESSLSDDIDSLDERISNEYTRATGAESNLSGAIQAETSRAMGAEGFYIEKSNVTLSTSSSTTVTFTDSRILATSIVEAYTTVDGIEYAGMVVSAGSCVMTFDEVETAITIGVMIWVR